MQEPRSMRELAAIHFQGHTEAKVFWMEKNKKIEELQNGKDCRLWNLVNQGR